MSVYADVWNVSLKMQMVIQILDSVWLPESFFIAVFFLIINLDLF